MPPKLLDKLLSIFVEPQQVGVGRIGLCACIHSFVYQGAARLRLLCLSVLLEVSPCPCARAGMPCCFNPHCRLIPIANFDAPVERKQIPLLVSLILSQAGALVVTTLA